MKRSIQTTKIVEEVIRQKPKARWLFLTLSVKNVFGGKALDKSLKAMAQGFNRLMKYKKRNKKKEVTAIQAAVQETAKYSVKDADYLTGNLENDLEVAKDLEEGLYRKRRIAYGGLLKKVHKQLNLDDVEEGDLIRVDDEDSDIEEKAYSIVARWNWKAQNYFIHYISEAKRAIR